MWIYLIRHGSTAGNLEHRYVGITDEGLTGEAADFLNKECSRYPVPELVYVSPMKRCTETAVLLFPGIPSKVAAGLKECDFGEFEYKNYQDLQDSPNYQAWIDSGGRLAFPGGESREEFAGRCVGTFEQTIREAAAAQVSSVAFVVHGGTIMAILERFGYPRKDYFDWQVKNGCGFACRLNWAEGSPENGAISGSIAAAGITGSFWLEVKSELPYALLPTGIEEHYVSKQNKKLRCGYTTGSCAAAAAKGAAEILLGGRLIRSVSLMTPKGIRLQLPLESVQIGTDSVLCGVRKFAGDDPDATDGALILAEVSRTARQNLPDSADEAREPQIFLDGGEGVGRVTRPGLEQSVGTSAINRVPRQMIRQAVASVCEEQEYSGALQVVISVPEGLKIAQKTFNPRIGIEGGISILGTSGIVVPMSEEALIASIRLEMQQKLAEGSRILLITPGNYGESFIRRRELSHRLDAENSMKCSNYVGETVDMAVELGAEGILFVSHIGKFIKVSGGIMNTHSAMADCRAELMAAQAMRAGAGEELVGALLNTNTTEEAVALLQQNGLLRQTMEQTAIRVKEHLQKRCRGRIRTEAVLYSNQLGYLGETDGAELMMEEIVQAGEPLQE